MMRRGNERDRDDAENVLLRFMGRRAEQQQQPQEAQQQHHPFRLIVFSDT